MSGFNDLTRKRRHGVLGILAALPPVLIALIFQRYIVGGLAAGAVKG